MEHLKNVTDLLDHVLTDCQKAYFLGVDGLDSNWVEGGRGELLRLPVTVGQEPDRWRLPSLTVSPIQSGSTAADR